MANGEQHDGLGSKEATEALTRVFPLAWLRWISFAGLILSVVLLLIGIFSPGLFENRISREFLCILVGLTMSVCFFCLFPTQSQGQITWKDTFLSAVALAGPILYFFLLYPFLSSRVVDPQQRVYVPLSFVDTQNNQTFQVKAGAVTLNAQPGSAEKVIDDNGNVIGFVALLPGGNPIELTLEMPSHQVEKNQHSVTLAGGDKIFIRATPKPLR